MKLKQPEKIKEMKAKLDTISPSFCLAKWLQTTIYLNRGTTHSCTLCPSHSISPRNLEKNPSSLSNTPIKMFNRDDMLNGKFPKECDYCWIVEDMGNGHFSDRMYKSSSSFAEERFDEIVASGTGETFVPSYVEVSFDSVCNLKCLYCTPWASTRWQDEIEKFGPYTLAGQLHHTKVQTLDEETNPFLKAFWKWWLELSKRIEVFRVTGGEPLMSRHVWRVFDLLKEEPHHKLTFGVNSNFAVTRRLVDSFIEEVNTLTPNLKSFVLFASAEAYGKHQEYIRSGMDFELFKSNLEAYLENTGPTATVFFSTTINILCYNSFEQFLEWLASLKLRFPGRVNAMFIFIRGPEYFDLRLLPDECKKSMGEGVDRMIAKYGPDGIFPAFFETEIDQLHRLMGRVNSEIDKKDFLYRQLKDFISQSDERKGTNARELFPELAHLF